MPTTLDCRDAIIQPLQVQSRKSGRPSPPYRHRLQPQAHDEHPGSQGIMETTACRLNGREAAQPALKTKTDGFSVFYTHPRTGLIRLVFQLVDQAGTERMSMRLASTAIMRNNTALP